MARRNRGRGKRGQATGPMDVRVVDDHNSKTAISFDRQLSNMARTRPIRVLCSDSFVIPNAATTAGFVYSGASVRQFDDFVSMMGQFTEYRISAMRFEITDLNPGVPTPNVASTFHDVATTTYSWTFSQIVDGPDSRVIPPGADVQSWFWQASGPRELGYQSTEQTAPSLEDYGGLRLNVGAVSGQTGSKYQVLVKAIVQFRGRY